MLKRFSRILVVDDSQTMRKLVCGMLESLGFANFHQACDGQSALSLLVERRYCLVISDWNMEPMNGLQLLGELRKRAPLSTVPFILMTAHVVKFRAIARGDGAIHYLPKPFKQNDLGAKIAHVMSGAAA